jgi:ADP-ribosyl-[dinitrogen reductase] hydrolase
MWELHTRLAEDPFDVAFLARELSEEKVIRKMFANACYPEHGLPLILYLAMRHNFDMEACLLANANAGGDDVHRGMILGMILGAADAQVPDHLVLGLIAHRKLKIEIDAFADIALQGNAI